jgi:hypothetical protein
LKVVYCTVQPGLINTWKSGQLFTVQVLDGG